MDCMYVLKVCSADRFFEACTAASVYDVEAGTESHIDSRHRFPDLHLTHQSGEASCGSGKSWVSWSTPLEQLTVARFTL